MARPHIAPFRLACATLVLFALAEIARRVVGWKPDALGVLLDPGVTLAIEFCAAIAIVLRVVLRAEDRLAWAALAGYVVLTALGELGWALSFDALVEPPIPNWTDGPYLSAYVFAAAGLGLLLRAQVGGHVRRTLYLDGLIAGLSITAVCAAVVLSPAGTPASGAGFERIVTTAYPVCDLVLLGLIGAAYGVRGWRVGSTWLTLGAALAVVAVGDAAFWWATARDVYPQTDWIDGTWPLSLALLAWAAWRPAEPLPLQARADYGVIEVPLAFAGISLAVLLGAALYAVGLMAIVAAAAALLVTGARAWLTHRENVRLLLASRREAYEDGLTGLPNRRRLMRDLDLAFTRGTGPSTLVFLDLDGFKAYNDAHGHLAGDSLLVQMGCALRDAVADGGAAYRLGGDEFCMLLPGAVTARDPRIAGVVQALHGTGEDAVGVGASSGVVVLPREAGSPTAALRLADTRMYDDKSFRRRLRPETMGHGRVADPPAPGDRRAGLGPSV
ncbi:GGDEF domain-containing protein [Patulibacter americanus]|uniref:GGDEF domain-containing protein n=1 Tax=Patulibacter americanus TaxID=588672 RepID=UPI00041AC392|nr:GGDEF domain-containing protein [Patulibacter americanus]